MTTPSLDGTPVNQHSTPSGTSFTIGPITSTFTNGIVVIDNLANDVSLYISSITGGGLTFTRHAAINGGAGYLERWTAPVGSSVVNNITFTVNANTSGVFTSTALYIVSAGGDTVSFDAGGPQTGTGTTIVGMTTQETALVTFCARFGSDSAPTVTGAWSGIVSGVSGSFFVAGDQSGAAGTYNGTSSGTSANASIIDGFFDSSAQGPAPVPFVTMEF